MNEILAALTAASVLLEFVNKQAQLAKERGEWTPAEEAEFDAAMEEITAAPWWKPDPEP